MFRIVTWLLKIEIIRMKVDGMLFFTFIVWDLSKGGYVNY